MEGAAAAPLLHNSVPLPCPGALETGPAAQGQTQLRASSRGALDRVGLLGFFFGASKIIFKRQGLLGHFQKSDPVTLLDS